MRNAKPYLAGLALAAFTLPLHAENMNAPTDIPTVLDLAREQSQKLLFKARADRLDAEENYRSKLPASNMPGMPPGQDAPSLRYVVAVNGIPYATFVYADGSTIERPVGGKIPGGFTVLQLSPEKMTAELQPDAKGSKPVTVGAAQMTAPRAAAPAPAPAAQQPTQAPANYVPSYLRVPSITNVNR